MGNPRLPVAVAAATGADVKNPQRHRDRKAPPKTRPLGEASPFLKEADKAKQAAGFVTAWEAFRRELPWLTEGHRTLVEVACSVRGRMFNGEEIGITALSLLQVCLSKLGATPVDESRLNIADDGDSGDPMFDA
jgi:hypothetical protein